MKLLHFVLMLLFIVVQFSCGGESTGPNKGIDPDFMKVLFVGDDMTLYNEMTSVVSALSIAAEEIRPVYDRDVSIAGVSLDIHILDGFALSEIKDEFWDYVVLQESEWSAVSDIETMSASIGYFNTIITNSGSLLLLYLTPANFDKTEMQSDINFAYFQIGSETNAFVVPVGPAWQRVREQSPGMRLHDDDGIHSNLKGTYMTALVFYSVLYDKSPEGLPGTLELGGDDKEFVSLSEATFLQRIAWEVVQEYSN